MIVVSDTSALNYLLLIGEADVLHALFGGLVIPNAVQHEMLHSDAPEVVRLWVETLPPWAEVRTAETLLSFPGLGLGETEAISPPEVYAEIVRRLEEAETLAGLHEGLRALDRGEEQPAREAFEEIRQK